MSAELIQRCPELTLYEKELLVLRFPNEKSVAELAQHFHKTGGTISPQVNTAIEKYEAWYRSAGNEVSKIIEREDVLEDEQLRTLREKIKEEKKTIAEKKEKTKARKELREHEKIRLRYDAIENPVKLNDYVLKYVLNDLEDIARDIQEYFSGKNLKQIVKEAFMNRTLDPELVEYEAKVFEFCRKTLQKHVHPVKRQALLEKYNGVDVDTYCSEKKEGVECRIIFEYDADHPDRFFCPKHNAKPYSDLNRDTWVYYRCPVCWRVGEGEFKLEYLPENNTINCPKCGAKMAIDIVRLMKRGTMKNKHDVAYRYSYGHSDIENLPDRDEYANGIADSLTFTKWEYRERIVT